MPSKERRFAENDPDGIFPRRGPRGRLTHKLLLRTSLSRSTELSRKLIGRIKKQFHRDNWNDGIGSQLIYSQTTPLIVVDTNVVTRAVATKPQADCRKVIDVCIAGNSIPCVTEPIVFEYLQVIGRGTLKDNISFNLESNRLLDEFLTHCLALFGEPTSPSLQVLADRSDQKFAIAQALTEEKTGRPCLVVSRDRHLLDLNNGQETNIVHPTKFLALLATGFLALNL